MAEERLDRSIPTGAPWRGDTSPLRLGFQAGLLTYFACGFFAFVLAQQFSRAYNEVSPLEILLPLPPALVVGYFVWFGASRYRLQLDRYLSDSCLRCGYDLRGAPSGRCPECGKPVTARQRRRLDTRRSGSASAESHHHRS